VDDAIERVEEALGLVSMVLEDLENEEKEQELLEAVEILEDLSRDLAASQEMDRMFEQDEDNVEGLEDF